ncbi:MAG: RHS repeat-associated core domain-containing protein, partial [Candidatus Acidiferrum sp.]
AQTNRPDGMCFDANGNLTAESGTCPPTAPTYAYDAENRLIAYSGTGGAYTYDGNNLRVKKVAGSTTTVYIFSGAKVIAEYDNGAAPASPSREYIYSGAALLAKIEGGASIYYHPDQLSNRVLTDSSGNVLGQRGHYPFGDTWYESGATTKLQFTSYERDSESGNDYAMARSYIDRFGRFSSSDPLAGSLGNPQSLNRYAYVFNDPINFTDPLGLCAPGTICVTAWGDGGGDSRPVIPMTGSLFGGGAPDDINAEAQIFAHSGGGGNWAAAMALGGTRRPPPPPCNSGSLNDPNLFWADNFATPEQVDAFFQSSNSPASWDGYDAAAAFIAQGINPGLAVGVIGAETSFGNASLSNNNINNPFSAFPGGRPASSFQQSLQAGLRTVTRIEDTTFNDSAPLTALIDQNNTLNIAYEGDPMPARMAWANNVNSWFQRFAKFLGKCR